MKNTFHTAIFVCALLATNCLCAKSSAEMGINMKKSIFYIVAIVWVIAAIQYFVNHNSQREDKIVDAFQETNFEDAIGTIEATGKYEPYLEEGRREELVIGIAAELGIVDGYEVSVTEDEGKSKSTTRLEKGARNANTVIEIITSHITGENNISEVYQAVNVKLTLYHSINSAVIYKEKLNKILDNNGINAKIVLNLQGEYKGNISLTEKNMISDKMLEMMEAKIVSEHRSDDLYTIYGYTGFMKEYQMSGGQKVNVNIAINYNEEEDKTCLYVSSPVINGDY